MIHFVVPSLSRDCSGTGGQASMEPCPTGSENQAHNGETRRALAILGEGSVSELAGSARHTTPISRSTENYRHVDVLATVMLTMIIVS